LRPALSAVAQPGIVMLVLGVSGEVKTEEKAKGARAMATTAAHLALPASSR